MHLSGAGKDLGDLLAFSSAPSISGLPGHKSGEISQGIKPLPELAALGSRNITSLPKGVPQAGACPVTSRPGIPTQAPGKEAVTHGVGGDGKVKWPPSKWGSLALALVIRTLSSSRWPQRTLRDTFLTSLCWVGGQDWNGRG